MKKRMLFLLPIIVFTLAGAGCGPGEKKAVAVADSVSIPIQDSADLAISIDRKKWHDGVAIKLEDIPSWLTVLKGGKPLPQSNVILIPPKKEKETSTSLTLTLEAAKGAPVNKGHKIKFMSTSGSNKEVADTLVTVNNFELYSVGWMVMVLSVGSVLSLVSYCLFRVFTLPPVEVEETLQGPTTIDLPDTHDPD